MDGKLTTFREDSGRANGLYFDRDGNLLACEGGNRRVTSIAPDGTVTVLADSYDGKKLNSPNDLWIDPNDPERMIVGNDGGIGVTFDQGGNYIFPNVMAIGQCYEVSYGMEVPYTVCGGLQDNGSWCGPSRRQSGAQCPNQSSGFTSTSTAAPFKVNSTIRDPIANLPRQRTPSAPTPASPPAAPSSGDTRI